MAVLPRACPHSSWRVALGTSANGYVWPNHRGDATDLDELAELLGMSAVLLGRNHRQSLADEQGEHGALEFGARSLR